jgi:DNA polymerase III delta prime subunit
MSTVPSTTAAPAQWLRKYHPTQIADIIGHVRLVRQLGQWLTSIRQYNAEGGGAGNDTEDSGPVSRPPPITFLYVPSGIGKTTLVRQLLAHHNFHVYELNAGCVRSKKRITEVLEKIVGNQSVSVMRNHHQTIGILMDEVDGMSCGDKGGLHELFHIVQQQQTGALIHPVVCVGNRPYEKKLGPNLYQEFPVRRPSESEIAKRLQYICDCEQVRIDPIAVQMVVKYGAQDVRRTIHFLQELVYFFGNDPDREIDTDDVATVKQVTTKTLVDRNLFHTTTDVFARPQTAAALYDTYKSDENLIPMMLHENVPTQMMTKALPDDPMRVYTDLLHQYSISDVLYNSGCWELSYAHAALTCGYTNERVGRHISKSSATKPVQFTNTLTKSATQANTYATLTRMSTCFGVHPNHFSCIVPLVLDEVRRDASAAKKYPVAYTDVEKMLQMYNKWWPATKDRTLGLSVRQKREIKAVLGGDKG